MSQRALDRWGGATTSYQEGKNKLTQDYEMYQQKWHFMWPDKKGQQAEPMVPDLIRLAAEDRARTITASRPSIVCRPAKAGDTARTEADKRERILGAYWDKNRIMRNIPGWAFDSMLAGFSACKVWPEGLEGPRGDRYPLMKRVAPAFVYPGPTFTQGPFLDDCIIAYEEEIQTLEHHYGVYFKGDVKDGTKKAQCIEYYSESRICIVAKYPSKRNYGKDGYTTLLDEEHKIGCTPVVIGVRPTADGIYHGEFDNAKAMMNYANKFANMMLDEAILSTYPEKIEFDVEDSEESGPGATHRLESRDGRMEYLQHPNQKFSNLQLQKGLLDGIRTSVILSPARSGDSNASVISAAGITAEQAQYLEAVAGTQRDVLKPMLEAANEVAFKCDVAYSGDIAKTIYLSSSGKKENYNPKEDIGEAVQNEIVYGAGTALDPINRSVLALQQWAQGNGLMSRKRAMDLSAWVEDVQREEAQMTVEQLQAAGLAGILAKSASGELPVEQWAEIEEAVANGEKLSAAIKKFLVAAPLAAPVGSAPLPTNAPGIAGAAEGQQEAGPPIPDLAGLGLA